MHTQANKLAINFKSIMALLEQQQAPGIGLSKEVFKGVEMRLGEQPGEM